jgi:hypothetical protein
MVHLGSIPRRLRPAAARLLLVPVLALGLASCDQTVKRTLPAGIHAIIVAEFFNRTDQAAVPAFLLEDLRKEFRLDGRLTVVDGPKGADGQIDGNIVEYNRQPARFDANNVVQEYRLRIVVDFTFKDLGATVAALDDKGSKPAPTPGTAARKLERYTNYVVVPASGIAVETEADAQRRMVRELDRDIVLNVIESR